MKRSFKLRLFIQIFLTTAGIILLNRYISQHFLLDQLNQRTQSEMGQVLLHCADKVGSTIEFLHCARDIDSSSITKSVVGDYVTCPSGAGSSYPSNKEPCLSLQTHRVNLSKLGVLHEGRIEALKLDDGQMSWLGVRLPGKTDSPTIWLSSASMYELVLQIWALRDRNLIYVLPGLILMLILLTVYITYLVMRPIRLLESSLASLSSSNLNQATNLRAPYDEFNRFVEVFEDLRERLKASFFKARRFAADASHELRTPLTILRGNAEQLINNLPVGSDAQIQTRMISEEIERLIDITEKLLLLSRADGDFMVKDISDFQISEFLQQVVADAEAFHPELTIKTDIMPRVVLRCDQRLIQQLIYNLYSNAVKYNTPDGWIRFGLKADEGLLILELENPSLDISTDLPDLAFDRFYRGNAAHSRSVDGLGLGLSICQEIARLHEARLEMQLTSRQTVLLRLVINRLN